MNRSTFIKLSVAMAIFGSIGYFSRLSGLPSIELVFIRCISAVVFLTVYWLLSGHYKREKWNKKEMTVIIMGRVFLVLNWAFFFASFEKAAITVGITIYGSDPRPAIGWAFFRERVKILRLLAVLLAFTGNRFFLFGSRPAATAQFSFTGLKRFERKLKYQLMDDQYVLYFL